MDREAARQTIRREWRRIIPAITNPALRKVNGESSWICPLCGHGAHGDGLTVNPKSADGNGLKCFGCGFSGDIIDLYQQATGADHSRALTELAAVSGIQIDGSSQEAAPSKGTGASRPVKLAQGAFSEKGSAKTHPGEEMQNRGLRTPTAAPADFTAYYEACQDRIYEPEGEPAQEYLRKRGIIGPALYMGAGFDPQADPANAPGAMGDETRPHPCPRIIIPCSPGHYIARSIDPETPKEFAKMNPSRERGAAAPAIFNGEALHAQEVQEVFITEGAFDALSVIEAGGRAIGLNSTSNARALIEQLEENPTAATLILCLDNDAAGRNAAQVLQTGLQRLKIPFITADINNGHKDPNAALMADKSRFYDTVQDAIAEARAFKEKLRREAQQAEEERQRNTGAGMIDAFLETVKSRRYEPIPTGIKDIDQALSGGFTRQTLILLGAAPGAGKTALAQWIFEGMAKRGQTCIYLNLEMSREQMLARSISRIAAAQSGERISPAEIKQGYKWTRRQEEIITAAAEEYKKTIAPRMIYNPDGVKTDLDNILSYLETEAERAEAAGLPAPLVVLDYLQIVTGRDREDETSLIKRAVSSLKRFAMKHNTVIFAIIAHNRAANKTGTVTMESGRDTSALEYSADLQLGLAFTKCLKRGGGADREDLTPEDAKLLTLKITKGRDARIGAEVDLYFNGETMSYTQIAKDYEEIAPQRAGRKPK